METIIESTPLNFKNNEYLIDLIRHKNGTPYVRVLQTLVSVSKAGQQSEIKLSPSALSDLILVLEKYRAKISSGKGGLLSEIQTKNLIDAYYKGVSTKDLAIRYDCDTKYIDAVLTKRGIFVTEGSGFGKPPWKPYKRRR